MLVLLGIPLLYIELTVGQYMRRGPVQAMAKVCPLLKGTWLVQRNSHHLCTVKRSYSAWCLFTFRSGPGDGCHLLHHVYVLQHHHHLGPVLPLQFLPEPTALAELQQHLELGQLY